MKLRVTVQGKTYDLDVEILEDQSGMAAPAAPVPSAPVSNAPAPASPPPASPPPSAAPQAPSAAPSAGGNTFPSPIAGTIRAIQVNPGDKVEANQEMFVVEAMKMETSVSAPSAGTVKAILVNPGDNVQAGQALAEFE